MRKAQMGTSVEEPSRKEKKRLKKSLAGVKKGYKPTSGPSFQNGGSTPKPDPTTRFERRQAKKIAKAQTRSKIAEIEGEGTVAQKRDNRARRISTMAGTARAKTPKSISTSTSTSTSTTDNRNSGNTTNTTNSGSSSGSNSGATGGQGGAGGRSGSTSGVDNSRKSSTSVSQSQNNSRTTNVKSTSNTNVRQSQNNSRNSSKTINQSQDNSKNKGQTILNDNSTKTNNSRRNTQIGAGNTSTKNSNYKKGGSIKKYKTGGMVNANSKVSAIKSAGSKGVKSGVNAKTYASKVARGRVGGTSTAPKTAVPRAKYGMTMRRK